MKDRKIQLILSDAHPAYSYDAIAVIYMRQTQFDVLRTATLMYGPPIIVTAQFHRECDVISEPGDYLLFHNTINPAPFTHAEPLEIHVLDERTNGPLCVDETKAKHEHVAFSRWHAHAQLEYCKPGESKHAEIETLTGFDPRVEADRTFIHKLLDEYLNVVSMRLTAIETAPEEIAYALDAHGEYSFKENGFQIFSSIDRHKR